MKNVLVICILVVCICISGFSKSVASDSGLGTEGVQNKEVNVEKLFKYPLTRKLAEAAEHGDVQKIKALVSNGANINSQGLDGVTPLSWALVKGNLGGFNALLELGADPNLTDDEGDSAIILAAGVKDPRFLNMAIEHGGNVNKAGFGSITQLMIASAAGYAENINVLLEANANVNAQDALGNTALMYAVKANRVEVVRILIEAGANKLIRNEQELIALDFVDVTSSVEEGKNQLREILSTKPHDVFLEGADLELVSAAGNGDVERVRQLVAQGSDVNVTGKGGITPLLWALKTRNFEGYLVLLEAGANPNHSIEGLSVIHLAASLDDTRFLEGAIKKGGKFDLQGPSGITPLMVASRTGNLENVRLLVKMNVEVNVGDVLGLTALHYAVILNYQSVIQFLMNNGANPSQPDKAGVSAADYAKTIGRSKQIKKLLKME